MNVVSYLLLGAMKSKELSDDCISIVADNDVLLALAEKTSNKNKNLVPKYNRF